MSKSVVFSFSVPLYKKALIVTFVKGCQMKPKRMHHKMRNFGAIHGQFSIFTIGIDLILANRSNMAKI